MQALQLNPNYKDTYVHAGLLLASLNYLDRAVQMWEKALSIDSTDTDINRLIKNAQLFKQSNLLNSKKEQL